MVASALTAGSVRSAVVTVLLATFLAYLPPVHYDCAARTTCRHWSVRFAYNKWMRLGPNPVLYFRKLKAFSLLSKEKEKLGDLPIAMNIGANDFSMDFHEFGSIVKDPTTWHMVFVEPIPSMLEPLAERLRKWGAPDSQVQMVNSAVCNDSCNSMDLYTVPMKAMEQLNLTSFRREFSHLSSLDKETLLDAIRRSIIWDNAMKPHLIRSVEAMSVRCLSPSDLLQEVDVSSKALDFLAIDAEGADADILRAFLALDGCKPALLKFEWINMIRRWQELMLLIQLLVNSGYTMHQESMDLWAVSEQFL